MRRTPCAFSSWVLKIAFSLVSRERSSVQRSGMPKSR
jgi:hypothetical protein